MASKSFVLTSVLVTCFSVLGLSNGQQASIVAGRIAARIITKPLLHPPPPPPPPVLYSFRSKIPGGLGEDLNSPEDITIRNEHRSRYEITFDRNRETWRENMISTEERSLLEWYRMYVKLQPGNKLPVLSTFGRPEPFYYGEIDLERIRNTRENKFSPTEQSLLEWCRVYVEQQRAIKVQDLNAFRRPVPFGLDVEDQQSPLLTYKEICFIKEVRKNPCSAALLVKETKLILDKPGRNVLTSIDTRFALKETPIVKSVSARDQVVKLFGDGGFRTRIGEWYNTIDAKAPGKTIYVEGVTDKNTSIASIHLHFVSKTSPTFAKQVNAPVCNFIVLNSYLHMVYFEGNKSISSYVHVKNKNLKKYIKAFAALSSDQSLNTIIGDDKRTMEIIETVFYDRGLDCIKRRLSAKSDLSISEKVNRLHTLKRRPLDLSSTTIVNGLPADDDIAWKQGYGRNDLEDIRQLHGMMNSWFTSANSKIDTREAFIHELQQGRNDVVVAFAHADGHAIYINNEKITLAEFENMKKRNIASEKPRIIILIACNTGNIYATKGWNFKQDLKSMAQVMIEKGFGDYVIAPDCEIGNEDIKDFVEHVLSGVNLGELGKAGGIKFKKTSALIRGRSIQTTIYLKSDETIKDNSNS